MVIGKIFQAYSPEKKYDYRNNFKKWSRQRLTLNTRQVKTLATA